MAQQIVHVELNPRSENTSNKQCNRMILNYRSTNGFVKTNTRHAKNNQICQHCLAPVRTIGTDGIHKNLIFKHAARASVRVRMCTCFFCCPQLTCASWGVRELDNTSAANKKATPSKCHPMHPAPLDPSWDLSRLSTK